jgi:taurine dioxygenase
MTDNKSAEPIVRRVGVFLGAEVSNIDLSKPVPESATAILKQAHAEHGVLVFPDQQISSDVEV